MIEEYAEADPRIEKLLGKIESGIMDLVSVLYDDKGVQWMPEAWSVAVEAVGYNEEGRKFRVFELLMPVAQSISASLGVIDVSSEGYLDGLSSAAVDEDDE